MNRQKISKQVMWVILVTFFLVGCGAPVATPTIQPGDSERKLMVNDLERSYLLHIPPGLNNEQPVPVVFAFHGYTQSPLIMKKMAALDDVADQANFLVAYPKGVNNTWTYGGGGTGAATDENVDELAFIRQMLSDLETIATIDPKRIYAVGFSRGGALVYGLACDMSDIFAAIASVSGPMEYDTCQPSQPVSVLHVHGLADTHILYSDGVEKGIATWAQLNGCMGSAQVEELCPTFLDQIHTKLDDCTEYAEEEKPTDIIIHTDYASCQSGTAVELYTFVSGRHLWPSNYVPPFSEMIWDFFATHPKP